MQEENQQSQINQNHTEICLIFLRLRAVFSESVKTFLRQNLKIQSRTSFDLKDLKRQK